MGRLSVVLPAHNEADNLGPVIEDVLAYLDARGGEGEIVVVDDGSTDTTGECVRRWEARDARVRGIRHRVNAGYGAALRTGLAHASGERVCLMDADRQFAAVDIGRLEALPADLVLGVRAPRRDPWVRVVPGRGWNALVNATLGLGVRDVDCALKLLHRRVIERCPLRSSGAFISAELVARARAAGLGVREVEVEHHPRRAGRATGLSLPVVARACVELAVVGRGLRGQMYPRASASAVS